MNEPRSKILSRDIYQFKEESEEILCRNCDVSALDYFSNFYQKVPSYFYEGMEWYCCEECYEEKTKYEG